MGQKLNVIKVKCNKSAIVAILDFECNSHFRISWGSLYLLLNCIFSYILLLNVYRIV
jgi:hypothetical protein